MMTEFVTKLDDQVQSMEKVTSVQTMESKSKWDDVNTNIISISKKLNEVAIKCGVPPGMTFDTNKQPTITKETVPADDNSLRGTEVE